MYQIMNALEEKARELNQSSILLHVFGHNTPAIELYKKCGLCIDLAHFPAESTMKGGINVNIMGFYVSPS